MSKATHAQRMQYVADHVGEFLEIAEKPLSGSRSWMTKDDPWQYLAACVEFSEVLLQLLSLQLFSFRLLKKMIQNNMFVVSLYIKMDLATDCSITLR